MNVKFGGEHKEEESTLHVYLISAAACIIQTDLEFSFCLRNLMFTLLPDIPVLVFLLPLFMLSVLTARRL